MKNTSPKKLQLANVHKTWGQLAKILKKLMANDDVDAVQLSKKTGIPPTTINRMRSDPDSNPTLSSLIPLASFFSISVSQLIGDEPLPKDRLSPSYNPQQRIWRSLPLITWEQAAQWPKSSASIKESEQTEWLYTDVDASQSAFALCMRGDSMSPRFPENTTLIFEPEASPENRDFVLFLQKDYKEPLFRQILIDGPEIYLKALNADFKDIKAITFNEDNIIIGVMIQAKMNFHNK